MSTPAAQSILFCLREQSLELLKVMQADDAFYRLAVTDDDERRDAAHAEALRKAGRLPKKKKAASKKTKEKVDSNQIGGEKKDEE